MFNTPLVAPVDIATKRKCKMCGQALMKHLRCVVCTRLLEKSRNNATFCVADRKFHCLPAVSDPLRCRPCAGEPEEVKNYETKTTPHLV